MNSPPYVRREKKVEKPKAKMNQDMAEVMKASSALQDSSVGYQMSHASSSQLQISDESQARPNLQQRSHNQQRKKIS